MRWFLYVIIIIWLERSFSIPENCEHNITRTITDCNFTDYESYVECARKRIKRQTNCEEENSFSSSGSADDCSECDCNYCNENHCNSPCNSCCSCKTRGCCHRTCHSQCTSASCRRSCKKLCSERIMTNGRVTYNTTGGNLHNITTVINLQNIINNTNVVNMPVHVNNTNINNITVGIPEHLFTNFSSPRCCQIISPRQCTPYNQFPFVKCYHYRKHVCSNICQSGIVHAQPHQVCDEQPSGPPNCHQQTIYVPQPQPKCVSTSTWPYLICGIKQICDSCYSEGKHCPSACNNVGPYQHPSPWFGYSGSGFSSPGFGFSSPPGQISAYPAYLGLPENQFSFGLLGNPEVPSILPHQNGDLPGDLGVPVSGNSASMYVTKSLSSNDVIQTEVVQPTEPSDFLDNAVDIKTIKSAKPPKGNAAIIIIE